MESGHVPSRVARRPLARPYVRSSPNRFNRTNNRAPHEGVNSTISNNEMQEPPRRQAQNRRSLASFLAQQNHEEPISLVEFGQAYILDDSISGTQELHELLSPTHTRLGHADLNELKSLHENASTADQRGVIEALIGAELLNLHRNEIIIELQSALTNLHGLMRARPMPHSPFGIADPTTMFRFDGAGRFNPVDFNAEYEEFRSTVDVTDSDDMKLVADRNDLRRLTTRRRDIRTDGLIRIPPTFRSILKSFVLHVADLPVGSEYSVKFDEMLGSVVKESRRSYRREAPQDQPDQSPE